MSVSLPQPPSSYYQKGSNLQQHRPYKYVPYDVFETDWLGDSQLLHLQSLTNENIDTSVNSLFKQPDKDQRYAPGALVWVLLSKGKPKQPNHSAQSGYDAQCLHKKRRNKKNKRKVNDDDATTDDGVLSGEISNTDENVHAEKEASVNQNSFSIQKETTTLNHSRKEFFLRARVISDDEPISSSENGDADNGKKDAIVNIVKRNERRVLVRYSKGATYRVRAYNLVPVLEPTVQSDVNNLPPLVVIVPETNIYRRVAKIHTTPEDSFMEIGCDYGITVDKIYKSLEEAGDVPKVWPPVEIEGGVNGTAEGNEETSDRVACLGVDRSTESIDIANER